MAEAGRSRRNRLQQFLWPAIVGLFLAGSDLCAASEPELSGFSRDDALAHSQAVIGGEVQGIELLATDGGRMALESYRGKPLVVSLVFSSCHYVCPTTTQFLREVVAKARGALGAGSFRVVTVGFDTANDTPERMAQLRTSTGVSDPHWDFLSGDENNVARLVRQLGFLYSPSPRGFDHLIQTSVIDAQGRVYRQVYGMQFPTPQLVEPLKDLVFGRPRSQTMSALDYLGNRVRLFCTVYDPATDTYHIDISVFIGTFVGLVVSLVFGRVLYREWRRSFEAGR